MYENLATGLHPILALLTLVPCLFQALLSKGADPNGASSGTAAALVLAAKSGHSGVVRAFKEHKAANGHDNKVKTCDFSALDADTR